MIQFETRPSQDRREYEATALKHVHALHELTLPDGSPDYELINDYIKDRRNQIWGSVKPSFMAAQNRKCGFCEVKLTQSTGDVEHFRPKNAVWTLMNPGVEVEDLVNVRGRNYSKDFDSGYWWLAYSWDNYLVSCPTCNQKWKSALFPVVQPRNGRPVIGDESQETTLLLDPFGSESPSDHLSFDDLGQVEPRQKSQIGTETIKTCGLDRESLRSSRHEKAVRAHRLLRNLLASKTAIQTQTILDDFHELGKIEYEHSGMVRSIFEQSTGMKWRDLEAKISVP